MNRVAVKPALYRWAQERSGVAPSDLASRFPKLPEWEGGTTKPTLKQLEGFARATYTPVGFFFLDRPPEEPLPIPDLRSGRSRRSRPSPHLLDTIYICQQRQEWFRAWARVSGDLPLDFIGSVTTRTPIVRAAAEIRSAITYELDQRPVSSTEEALRAFIERVDALGILVMRNGVVGNNTHRRLDPEEFRGFALSDDWAPLVFLNGADSRSAQMFTLAHELGHLWLGRSALDDTSAAATPDDAVERWCNDLAAELLVPMNVLRGEAGAPVDLAIDLPRLVRRFRVSSLVILRRLHDAQLISRRSFRLAYDAELERAPRRGTSSGGDFYRTEIAKVGRRFASSLVSSTLEGHTLYKEAFRLLGISRDTTFAELGRQLHVIA